jgi:hypothetical protein
MTGDRQVEHFGSCFPRGDRPFELVRGNAGWKEPYLIEPALLAALLRHEQVPVMDRVECAA